MIGLERAHFKFMCPQGGDRALDVAPGGMRRVLRQILAPGSKGLRHAVQAVAHME